MYLPSLQIRKLNLVPSRSKGRNHLQNVDCLWPALLAVLLSLIHPHLPIRKTVSAHKIQLYTSAAGDGLCVSKESGPELWRLCPAWTEWYFFTLCASNVTTATNCISFCSQVRFVSHRWRTQSPHGSLQYPAATSSQPQYLPLQS